MQAKFVFFALCAAMVGANPAVNPDLSKLFGKGKSSEDLATVTTTVYSTVTTTASTTLVVEHKSESHEDKKGHKSDSKGDHEKDDKKNH